MNYLTIQNQSSKLNYPNYYLTGGCFYFDF